MTAKTNSTHFSARRPSAVVGFFARLYLAVTDGASLSFSNLGRLSDAHLADIGLTRFDVPRAAAADILNR